MPSIHPREKAEKHSMDNTTSFGGEYESFRPSLPPSPSSVERFLALRSDKGVGRTEESDKQRSVLEDSFGELLGWSRQRATSPLRSLCIEESFRIAWLSDLDIDPYYEPGYWGRGVAGEPACRKAGAQRTKTMGIPGNSSEGKMKWDEWEGRWDYREEGKDKEQVTFQDLLLPRGGTAPPADPEPADERHKARWTHANANEEDTSEQKYGKRGSTTSRRNSSVWGDTEDDDIWKMEGLEFPFGRKGCSAPLLLLETALNQIESLVSLKKTVHHTIEAHSQEHQKDRQGEGKHSSRERDKSLLDGFEEETKEAGTEAAEVGVQERHAPPPLDKQTDNSAQNYTFCSFGRCNDFGSETPGERSETGEHLPVPEKVPGASSSFLSPRWWEFAGSPTAPSSVGPSPQVHDRQGAYSAFAATYGQQSWTSYGQPPQWGSQFQTHGQPPTVINPYQGYWHYGPSESAAPSPAAVSREPQVPLEPSQSFMYTQPAVPRSIQLQVSGQPAPHEGGQAAKYEQHTEGDPPLLQSYYAGRAEWPRHRQTAAFTQPGPFVEPSDNAYGQVSGAVPPFLSPNVDGGTRADVDPFHEYGQTVSSTKGEMPFMDAYAQQGTPGVQPEVYIQPVAGVPQLPHTYFGAHMNHGGFSSLPHSRPNPLWLSGTPSNPPGGPQGGQQGEGYFHMYPGFPSPEDSPMSASSFGSHKGASYSQVEDPTGRYGLNESLLAGDPQTSQRDMFWPSATPAGAFQVPPRQPARMPGQQSQMDYSTGGYPSSFPNPPVSRLPHYAFSSGVSPERQFGAYAARDPAAGYFDIGQQPAWPYQVPNAPEAYAQQSQDPLQSSGAQRAFNSSYGSGDQARFLPPVRSEQPHGSPHGEDGNKAGAESSVPSFYSDSSAFGDEYVPRYYAPKSFNTADVQGTKGTQPTDRPANWGAAPRRAAHAGARRELREPSRQEQKTYFDRVTEEDEGKEKADGRDGGGKEREKEREAWTEEQDVVDRRLCLARTPIEAILVTGDFAGKACLEDEEEQWAALQKATEQLVRRFSPSRFSYPRRHSPFFVSSSTSLSQENHTDEERSEDAAKMRENVQLIFVAGDQDMPLSSRSRAASQKWRKRLYELWQGVLPLDKRNRETFLRGLYYETRLRSRANIRILVLNSFLYSVPDNDDPRGSPVSSSSTPETTEGARESDEEQDDPHGQLAWLEARLRSARARRHQVILAGHIPPGVAEDAEDSFEGRSKPLWKAKFTRRYLEITRQFSDVILAHLFGHLHRDAFRVLSPSSPPPSPSSFSPFLPSACLPPETPVPRPPSHLSPSPSSPPFSSPPSSASSFGAFGEARDEKKASTKRSEETGWQPPLLISSSLSPRRGRDPTWSLLLFSPYTYTQRLPESRSPVFSREDWPVKELLLPRPRYVLQDLFSYSLSLHFAAESPLESLETDVETALGFREAGRKLQADSLSRKAARASERNQCGRQAAAADAAKTTEREREGQERERRRKERKDDSPKEAVNPLEKSASPSPSAAAGKTEAPAAGGASEDRRRLSSPCPPTDTKSGTTEGEGTEEDGGEGDEAAVKGGENHECARENTVDNERAREAAEGETAEREAAETNEAEVKEARKNRSERKATAEQEGVREAAEVDGIAWSASERGERENDTIEEEELTRHETPIHDGLATARKEKGPQIEEQKDSEPSLRIAVEPAFSPFVQEESRQSATTDAAPVSDPSLPSLDRTTVEASAERNRNAGKVDFEQEAQSSRQTAVWKRSTASTSRAPVEIAEAAGRKKETHDKERSGDAGAEGESVDRQMAFNAHHVGTQDAGVCKKGRATDAVSSPSTGRSSESFELPPLPPVSPVDGTSVGCRYSSTESLAVARDSASSTERAASPSASANEERRRRRLHVAQPAFMLHYVFTSVHRAPCLAAPVLAELAERGRDRRHFFALQMLLQAFSPQAPPASVYCETRFLEASEYLACLRTLTKNRHRDKRERAGET
ncbi:hypothetical protein TGRH88_059810 [Toxoplasma gondii]|uniref:Ser/Thr phosphatase family protein n=1 Tax=Toxoplasma gondii TaxID=5811 RepID=A0A7J6JTA9_TOXGO|nr:hypothetical protein TGRH88_059810 [Toxoplasma gondii]